jgi:sortase A
MKETRSTQTFTALSMALLALGLMALLGMAFLRHPTPVKLLPQSRVPQLIATQTLPPVRQAITTPQLNAQPTSEKADPTAQSSQPQLPPTSTAAVLAVTQGTPLSVATVIATAAAPVSSSGERPIALTPTQQASVPTHAATSGTWPGSLASDEPDNGDTGSSPVLTSPPLLPGEATAVQPVAPTVGVANVSTPQPTAKLLQAAQVPQAPPGQPASSLPAPTRVISAPTAKPTAKATAKATAKPKPGVPVLPNGVVYGDHKPNLPSRIVRIASPNIRLDTSVYEVYAAKGVWEVADYAAGHHYNSKNPGEGGNIVMAGHNNWRGEVFRYVVDLKPGNLIKVWTLDGKEHHYTVESVNKVLEAGATQAQRLKNAKVMDPTPTEQLTLITCWPYTTFTHRVIVVAKPSP